MHMLSIKAMQTELALGTFSSVELTKTLLKRIHAHNKNTNSFITVTEEEAMHSAKQADQLRTQGKASALTGIPIAYKDLFCTQGIRSSSGSKMLDQFISPYDATVVTKLKEAGTVMLGKTNMDEFAMGSSNETSFYGAVRNPWARDAVPGGSSGGSASAVADRLAPGTIGSDTGGSIRQPAAFCGITGIKPTYGRISRYGMIAFASSLDQAGPMAHTAEDCALLLNAMTGFDEKDSTSIQRDPEDFTATLTDSLQGTTIGLPKQYFEGLPSPVAQCIQDALRIYEQQGATLIDIDLPLTEAAVAVYYVIASAECSSNLARFDGVRYGHRCTHPEDLNDLYIRSRSEGFGEEVQRRIMIGTYVLSAGYYDAYYAKAQKIRRLIRDDFRKTFQSVDLIASPTTPEPAFSFGEKSDPVSMYLSDIYTIPVNLAGLPALSHPAGFVNQRPVGLQLMGDLFNEHKILNAAHQFQQHTDFHQQRPHDLSQEEGE